MGLVVAEVSGGRFSGKNKNIKEDLIEPAIEYIRGCKNYKGLGGGRQFDGSGKRIDITEETRRGETLLKIQVQWRSYTYASVMIYKSAIDACNPDENDTNGLIPSIVQAITLSYENQKVYGITFT